MATAVDHKPECSEAEWKARQDLAVCYRIFDHLGWCESIYNHIIANKNVGLDNTVITNGAVISNDRCCRHKRIEVIGQFIEVLKRIIGDQQGLSRRALDTLVDKNHCRH